MWDLWLSTALYTTIGGAIGFSFVEWRWWYRRGRAFSRKKFFVAVLGGAFIGFAWPAFVGALIAIAWAYAFEPLIDWAESE